MVEKNFRDYLISSRHVDATREPESGDARARAAQHQQTPVYELNSPRLTNHKGERPAGYSIRDESINPLRRQKGLPEIK